MSFIGEFKEFISRGNVMDMAVGVVVGGAFKSIADSLVADIIMPVISIITQEVNIADLKATIIAPTEASAGLVIPYGNFLQTVLQFIIIAFAVFCMVKVVNTARKKLEKPKAEAAPEPSAEEKLLIEIRDLLKDRK